MIDLMFPVHNRLAFVEASFDALVKNTNWDLVRRLYITDDNSTDGTYEHLTQAIQKLETPAMIIRDSFGGPVNAMNYILDHTDADVVGKIDSDLVLPPGWIEVMLDVLGRHPELDALGTEPGFGEGPQTADVERTYLPARWIGGVGLFRARVFKRHRPVQNDRFFGLTAFWRQRATCGWLTPQIPCFLLDHIDVEPWRSLSLEYIEKGWARPWDDYFTAGPEFWSWWMNERLALT